MYWLTGLAGIMLMIAPYVCSYASNITALWTSIGVGFTVLVVSVWEGVEEHKENWEYWVVAIIGIFAIIAPFLLGFGAVISAVWTVVSMGTIIAILAGSKVWNSGNPLL